MGFGAGLRARRWSLDLRISNLTDSTHMVTSNDFDSAAIDLLGSLPPGVTFNENFQLQPRMVRVTLRVHI